jgi:hypothetical protein
VTFTGHDIRAEVRRQMAPRRRFVVQFPVSTSDGLANERVRVSDEIVRRGAAREPVGPAPVDGSKPLAESAAAAGDAFDAQSIEAMTQQTSHLSLTTQPLGDRLLVIAHAHGTLDGNDYDQFLPELDALMAENKPLRFLLILENFRGWDLEGFWRELKWDEKNRDRLERIAVVGEASWQKWSTLLSKWFLPGNIRYFDRSEEPAARAWLEATK